MCIGVCRAADVSSRGSRQGQSAGGQSAAVGAVGRGEAPLAVLGGAKAAACS